MEFFKEKFILYNWNCEVLLDVFDYVFSEIFIYYLE